MATKFNRNVFQPAVSLYSKAVWSLCTETELVSEMKFKFAVVQLITQGDFVIGYQNYSEDMKMLSTETCILLQRHGVLLASCQEYR